MSLGQTSVEEQDKENIDANIANSTLTHKIIEETAAEPQDFAELDDDMLAILNDGEVKEDKMFIFHPKLAAVWEEVLSEGIKKDKKSELLNKHPRTGNCPILTPKLNPEIEATINVTAKKRDKFLVADQELCGASISALAEGITMILNDALKEVDIKELLSTLIESGKLMCELNNQLTKARKAFLYPGLDKKAKSLLEKSKAGEFLFGPELSQRIKTAQAVEKLGMSLKTSTNEKKSPFQASSSLNWKSPSATSRGQSQAGFKRPFFQRSYGHSKMYGKNRQSGQDRVQSRQSSARVNTASEKK